MAWVSNHAARIPRRHQSDCSHRGAMREAVSELVGDGASVLLGAGLEGLIPFAAGHEIIRQRKRELTVLAPISDMLFDQMIGAGCVATVRAA